MAFESLYKYSYYISVKSLRLEHPCSKAIEGK